MDEEYTAGYKEPCAQCAEVNWGISDEGRFYCRSCHNVIERTREAEVLTFQHGTSRVTTINKGPRTKREGAGYTWTICEGFQFILKKQADALLRLGLSSHFKDEVLCQLWRLFLHKSQQAYCQNQATNFKFGPKGMESDSDSAAESITWTTDGESNPPSTAGSDAGGEQVELFEWSGAGSLDQ